MLLILKSTPSFKYYSTRTSEALPAICLIFIFFEKSNFQSNLMVSFIMPSNLVGVVVQAVVQVVVQVVVGVVVQVVQAVVQALLQPLLALLGPLLYSLLQAVQTGLLLN